MSKSLKKLIDINRLREFKNKLVGTGSAYVQTGAVDQTVAGTKTFSKPIVGSVTGSSGSCTGNAATATKLATARSLWGNEFDGSAAITGPITGMPAIEFKPSTTANNGGYLDFHYNQSTANYSSRIIESAPGTLSINSVTITTKRVVTAATFVGNITGNVTGNCSGSSGSCTGNAATATKLAAKRTIALSGAVTGTATGFDGSGNITIPVTALDASKLTGTASVNTTGNAATATRAVSADSATNASHATSADEATKAVSADSATNASHATSADKATNATYANWLRTSSHTDHLFHTEWDKAGYFWTYVTTGNGEYRAVRVARSDQSGNADTATKLAAKRTIALSGAVTGTATGFDGSGNVTIPVTALSPSAIRAQWYAAYPDGAEAHNAMWGGRDITAAFNNGTVSANIANGTFKDIFPGDYITKSVTISGKTYDVTWVVADCDYWINKGDTPMTAHHVAIVPQTPIFDARMNATNTTEGGYMGSRMFKETIPACATGIVNAFGSSHILTFRDAISNSMDTGHDSSGIPQYTGVPVWWGEWVSCQCNLMSEKMVYGAPVCSGGAMENTMATRQMSAFRLSEKLINYRRLVWWLRDVVASTLFADVLHAGNAHTSYASNSFGVRPFALLC